MLSMLLRICLSAARCLAFLDSLDVSAQGCLLARNKETVALVHRHACLDQAHAHYVGHLYRFNVGCSTVFIQSRFQTCLQQLGYSATHLFCEDLLLAKMKHNFWHPSHQCLLRSRSCIFPSAAGPTRLQKKCRVPLFARSSL